MSRTTSPTAGSPWRRRLRPMLLALLGLLAVLVLLLAGAVVWDAARSPGSAPLTNVRFDGPEGAELRGYLTFPLENPSGPHPAVLLIHEWWGLNEGMITLADALAAEGYVVLAADAYRGRQTGSVPRALWMRLTTPEALVKADLDAALDWLLTLDEVEADRVASMGFCFGGGHSLQLGLRRSESLAMTLMYYGAVVTEPELLRPLVEAQPVLGVFAEEDQTIFPAEVLEFESALNSLDIANQISIYEDVGHAFVTEENYDDLSTAGGRAWREAVDFLAENL